MLFVFVFLNSIPFQSFVRLRLQEACQPASDGQQHGHFYCWKLPPGFGHDNQGASIHAFHERRRSRSHRGKISFYHFTVDVKIPAQFFVMGHEFKSIEFLFFRPTPARNTLRLARKEQHQTLMFTSFRR